MLVSNQTLNGWWLSSRALQSVFLDGQHGVVCVQKHKENAHKSG